MMNRKFDVYGVGNAIMDLQLHIAEHDLQQLALEKGAMKLMEEEEQLRLLEFFSSRTYKRASGGSAANTMIAISQLGGRAAFSGLVADDEFGQYYAKEMKSIGVVLNNPPISRKNAEVDPRTGTCVVLITPDAERTMNTHLGVSAQLAPVHLSQSHLTEAKWLYIEGYLFSQASGSEAAQRAVEIAKQSDVKVAVTFSDGFIVDFFRAPLDSVVREADLIFCNLNEGRRFTGESDEENVFRILKDTVPNVAFTMSERGAWISFDQTEVRLPAFPVKAIDDTGAGDMFAGAFLYGITNGRTVNDAGKMACFLASRVVSQVGARLSGDIQKIVQGMG